MKPEQKRTIRYRVRQLCGLFLVFLFLYALQAYADTVDLSVTYGYQNTAKAGRFLPLCIDVANNQDSTFSGYVRVCMVESEESIYAYRYQKTVEAHASDTLDVTVALSSGVSQLLVTAEDRAGNILGSRRIGLDVAGSDAELIIGVVSDHPEALSYLNDAALNNGLLRTRSVVLPADGLPDSENELDQLDVLLISDFDMSKIRENEASVIGQWVRNGGILLLGTGARGMQALEPYYSGYLKSELQPIMMNVQMKKTQGSSDEDDLQTLMASPVYMLRGREVLLSDGFPMVSEVTEGAGLVVISGYDFCDLTRYATDQGSYADALFTAVLGKTRLEKLSVSASEQSLAKYWDVQALMNLSDLQKLPKPVLYAAVLGIYVLLAGPGIYFYMRRRRAMRMYRPGILLLSVLTTVLIYALGYGTRFHGPFLTYVQLKNISENSIDETDFLNFRSPYVRSCTLQLKTEYDVYPILKGADYSGDIQTLLSKQHGVGRTDIDNGREKKKITVSTTEPFSARYFELHNNMPNAEGSFHGEICFSSEQISGTLTNDTAYDLSDAALLIYGKVIRIGNLKAGERMDLAGCEAMTVPVGDSRRMAAAITDGSAQNVLQYYLANDLNGYFDDARLIGCVRTQSGRPDFTDQMHAESYGMTLVISALPLSTRSGDTYSYNALFADPVVQSGSYDASTNTMSGSWPTVLEYHLGEGSSIVGLTVETLTTDDAAHKNSEDGIGTLRPFRGSMSFLNHRTGGFDVVDTTDGMLTKEQLEAYLDENNVLTVRYTSGEENVRVDERRYLPMLIVTAEYRE